MNRPVYLSAILLLTLSLLGSPASCAEEATPEEQKLLQQRQDFLAAETALKNRDLATYQQHRSQLADYPLLVYLDYQETLDTLEQQSVESIRNRMERLAGTPLSARLRDHWLELLAKLELWPTYLEFSRNGGSTTQQCQRARAWIETGSQQQAYKVVPKLWLNGKSLPKECDPVLQHWIASGHLTQALVWERFDRAMSQRNTRLARYLKRYLSDEEKPFADLWLTLYKHPEQIDQLLSVDHPKRDEMAIQAIRKLAWRDVDAAFHAWEKFHSLPIFSKQQQQKALYALAGGLAREPSHKLSNQLNSLLPEELKLDSGLSERALQAALQQDDWNWVIQIIEAVPEKQRGDGQWRYWQARALEQLGRAKEAEAILTPLAQERSYYGFLAAQRLGTDPHVEHVSLQIEHEAVDRIALTPGLQRARELHYLDRPRLARQEWNLALKNATADDKRAAARLAQTWDWPSQSIITLARLGLWNDLELRFPLAHRQAIIGQAKDHGIDSAWVYAILRQESAFISDARSSAGARGLMQLMPKTAKQIARELQYSLIDPDELFRPEVNIRLGTGYLNKIYRELQENPVLATAAYNAGPSRVISWLPEHPQASDVWIETIPYSETREYLKRVLAYTVIYNYRLGDPSKVIPQKWLDPIESRQSFSGV
ncbi:MAG: transglycosylase SLT domain-containing protein [Candidatus Thiodiazotropha sp.]